MVAAVPDPRRPLDCRPDAGAHPSEVARQAADAGAMHEGEVAG